MHRSLLLVLSVFIGCQPTGGGLHEDANEPDFEEATAQTNGDAESYFYNVDIPQLDGPWRVDAQGFNDAGSVVGNARHRQTGRQHGFVWIPGAAPVRVAPLDGHTGLTLTACNDSGVAVGTSWSDKASVPVVWIDGELFDLGSLGGDDGDAYDINDDGWIVGRSADRDGVFRAFVTEVGGPLTSLPGFAEGEARAINNRDVIAGNLWLWGRPAEFVNQESFVSHAAVWRRGMSGNWVMPDVW